jgi:glyceraldehyde-3-phosphate dehydrogenase (ferredoxin)
MAESNLKVLHVDASSGFYRMERFRVGEVWGPVDLGLLLAGRHDSLNIGAGLLAGSIFPGSNRLVITGMSPCWGGFYVSSMGGAGLVFDNLGINMLAIRNRAPVPSVLLLNRTHGEEIEVAIHPVDLPGAWEGGRGGVYALMQHVLERWGGCYKDDPRILAVGPAAMATDFGAIASAPIKGGTITRADTWAGRGGFGSKLLQQHGIAAVIFGGTFIDEDFRDRHVADEWFNTRYHKKLAAKDVDATVKYRYDPQFNTGGTFGVNYTKIGGRLLAFNYRSIYMREDERLDLHRRFVVDHYLKQFNEEIIETKSMRTCGEPCSAVCKKIHGEYKKDYEPYQTMGPLVGIFDQRAAEALNGKADALGFDAISVGGVLSWLMECLDSGLIAPDEVNASARPHFDPRAFDVVESSMHNARIGIDLLEGIVRKKGILDLGNGARRLARRLSRDRGRTVLEGFVATANARSGWMVPNQYWTPGVLAPMPIMGKYYMHYGEDFLPPRELGRLCAKRMVAELVMDNAGMCRFHRSWAEEMIPDIIASLYGDREGFLEKLAVTAGAINTRNASIFWESERSKDFIACFLTRRREVDGDASKDLTAWIDAFHANREVAALDFWYDVKKGINETLMEY